MTAAAVIFFAKINKITRSVLAVFEKK
jgi:hypothetical protein